MPPESQAKNSTLNKELIDRIVSSKVTPDDVTFLGESFGQKSTESVRNALFQSLASELTPNALHAFNRAIVENANNWVPENDVKFMGRDGATAFYSDLLRLEARRTGFTLEEKNNNFTGKVTIPKEILDHYATLKDKDGFYQQRGTTDINQAMAESITFMLTKDAVKDTAIYQALSMEATRGNIVAINKLINLEKEFAEQSMYAPGEKEKRVFIDQLVEEKISDKAKHQTAASTSISPAEAEKASSAIVTNMTKLLSAAIVDKSLKNLEQKGLSVDKTQKEKIQKLIQSVEKIPFDGLIAKQAEITAYLSKELESGRTMGSRLKSIGSETKQYVIATKNLPKIAQKLHDKFVEPQQTIGARFKRWVLRLFKPSRVGIIDSDQLKSSSTSVNLSPSSLLAQKVTTIGQTIGEHMAVSKSKPPPLPPKPRQETAKIR
jgi:hypothetical protein